MKKNLYLIFTIGIMLAGLHSFAQPTVNYSSGAWAVNLTNTSITSVITRTTVPVEAGQYSNASPSGNGVMWLEYGDGGFTTQQNSTWVYKSTDQNKSALLTTLLYDTTNNGKTYMRLSSTNNNNNFTSTNRTNTSPNDNSPALLSNTPGIKLTPNVFDIVPGDPMAMALTYDITESDVISPDSPSYYIVLCYNNGVSVFDELQNQNSVFNTYSIPNIRAFDNESYVGSTSSYISAAAGAFPLINSFTSKTLFKINNPNVNEHNLFITMKPKASLTSGGTSSVYAILVAVRQNTNNITSVTKIGESTLSNMPIQKSHDPNYIQQEPACLLLADKAKDQPFKYHVHFQNTGRGPADEVKVTVHFPNGFKQGSIIIDGVSTNFAQDFIGVQGSDINFTSDDLNANNDVTFHFAKKVSKILEGTDGVDNPLINPVTMGDIYFTITGTKATPDIINVKADIEFHSQSHNPSYNGWEKPVHTNIVTAYYKDCCDCNTQVDCSKCPQPNPKTCHCRAFLYICWYWWVIIAISLFAVYLLARKRKEK